AFASSAVAAPVPKAIESPDRTWATASSAETILSRYLSCQPMSTPCPHSERECHCDVTADACLLRRPVMHTVWGPCAGRETHAPGNLTANSARVNAHRSIL